MSAPYPFDIYDEASSVREADYGALEQRVLAHYLGGKTMEDKMIVGVDLAQPGSDMSVSGKIDMETGEVHFTPTGRIVWPDKLEPLDAYKFEQQPSRVYRGEARRTFTHTFNNERYVDFYARQNFDLRFGHLFPVYPAKHTLRNTTALRVIGG